jgi:hypothetical protein
MGPFLQGTDLTADFDAPKDCFDRAIHEPCVAFETFRDLQCQFSCGGQNQDPRMARTSWERLAHQVMKAWKSKSGGFACAGLSNSQQIPVGQKMWYGLSLNWRWRFIPLVCDGLEDLFVQAEIDELGQTDAFWRLGRAGRTQGGQDKEKGTLVGRRGRGARGVIHLSDCVNCLFAGFTDPLAKLC